MWQGLCHLILRHTLSDLWAPVVSTTVSVHVFRDCPVYVNTHWVWRMSKASATFVHTFKNTCTENTCSKLHVIIHGYIVIVLDANIYIYIYIWLLLINIYRYRYILMSIYYINTFVWIWNRLWLSLRWWSDDETWNIKVDVSEVLIDDTNFFLFVFIYSYTSTIWASSDRRQPARDRTRNLSVSSHQRNASEVNS